MYILLPVILSHTYINLRIIDKMINVRKIGKNCGSLKRTILPEVKEHDTLSLISRSMWTVLCSNTSMHPVFKIHLQTLSWMQKGVCGLIFTKDIIIMIVRVDIRSITVWHCQCDVDYWQSQMRSSKTICHNALVVMNVSSWNQFPLTL